MTDVDGRVARGERTRDAVIEAALELIEEGDPRPTAKAIAGRAGVALRSVFHHFADVETLLMLAADRQAQRYWHLRGPMPGAPLDARIAAAVSERAELFERIRFTRWVAVLQHRDSPTIATRLEESRAALRHHIVAALAPDLPADSITRTACEAAASWETWEVLRRDQGLSVPDASAAVVLILTALIER